MCSVFGVWLLLTFLLLGCLLHTCFEDGHPVRQGLHQICKEILAVAFQGLGIKLVMRR